LLRVPFETEDLPMLQEQQRNFGNRSLREANLGWLPGDAGDPRACNLIYARTDAQIAAATEETDAEAVPA
jgi:vanillate O-demethylase monooxygenase subunit